MLLPAKVGEEDRIHARANGSTVAHEELAPSKPHRPHAQTGSTPHLHP